MADRDFGRVRRPRDYDEPYDRGGYSGGEYGGGTGRDENWGPEQRWEGSGREGYGREGWLGRREGWRGEGWRGDWEGRPFGSRYGSPGYGAGYGYREPGYGRGYYGQESGYSGALYSGMYGGTYGAGTYGQRGAMWREAGREGHFGRGPRGYRRSDDRIREEINDRLTWHVEIDASDVDVRVENGEVTLTGVVEDRRAKRLAEDLAEEVYGVEDVHNQLKVRHGFLAGLTGEKADEREVSRVAEREGGEATTARRGARTATTAGTGTTAGATAGMTTGTATGATTETGNRRP